MQRAAETPVTDMRLELLISAQVWWALCTWAFFCSQKYLGWTSYFGLLWLSVYVCTRSCVFCVWEGTHVHVWIFLCLWVGVVFRLRISSLILGVCVCAHVCGFGWEWGEPQSFACVQASLMCTAYRHWQVQQLCYALSCLFVWHAALCGWEME